MKSTKFTSLVLLINLALLGSCRNVSTPVFLPDDTITVVAKVEAFVAEYPYVPARAPHDSEPNQAGVLPASILALVNGPPDHPKRFLIFLEPNADERAILGKTGATYRFRISRSLLKPEWDGVRPLDATLAVPGEWVGMIRHLQRDDPKVRDGPDFTAPAQRPGSCLIRPLAKLIRGCCNALGQGVREQPRTGLRP